MSKDNTPGPGPESNIRNPAITGQGPLCVGVVGLGPVGELSVKLAVRADFKVVGYDCDSYKVDEFRSNNCTDNILVVSDNPACLAETDVILVAIRLELQESGEMELEPLQKLATVLNTLPPMQRLILLETTTPPGVTRQFAEKWLQPYGDGRFLVAHCPERLKVGNTEEDLLRVPRLAGGVCTEATHLACQFLECLGIQAVPVSAPEVSELSKLLENAFLTVGIGLAGEITRISHALSIDAYEVCQAASTKPDGYFPFWPGPGIGGHCLPNDLYLLRQAATDLGVNTPILDGASHSIKKLTPGVVRRMEMLLKAGGQCLENARIWIIGIGFKAGSSDMTRTPAIDLVRELRSRRALPIYSDSNNNQFKVDDVPVERVPPETFPEAVAGAVILAGDRSIDLATLNERIPVILDAGGAKIMSGSSPRMRSL